MIQPEKSAHNSRTERSDLAQRCLDARKAVAAFFDWANYNDSRKRERWETWATQRAHDGWTTEAIHHHTKRAWIEHRRAVGKPIRIALMSKAEMALLMETFRKAFANMPEWQPREPWWERVGQFPGNSDWFNQLNRNREAAGLPEGPPWLTGHEKADEYWSQDLSAEYDDSDLPQYDGWA